MNVTCAECGSVFRVDPTKIPQAGIRARCSVCGGVIAIGEHGAIDEDFVAPAMPRTSPATSRSGGNAPAPAARPGAPAPQAKPSAPPVSSPTAAPAPRPPATLPTPPMLTRTPPIPERGPAAAPSGAQPKPASPTQAPPAAPPRMPQSAPAAPHTSPSRAVPPTASPAAKGAAPAFPSVTPPTAPGVAPVAPRAPVPPPASRPPASTTPTPNAPAAHRPATPSAASAPATRPPINPFLANDPNQKAKRLARALISDIIAYFPDKHREGLQNGTLKELFREEIKKSYEEYVEQMGKDFATSTTHFQDALNEVLAKGQKVF